MSAARHQYPLWPSSQVLGRWERTHDYDIWTDCRSPAEEPLALWEARSNGVVRIPDAASVLHVIPGGVPHHVQGLFGYWRACDSDIIWMRLGREDFTRYAMILGGSPADYVKDRISWICPGCATTVHSVEIETGRANLSEFWAREPAIVAEFNADERLRTCLNCARVHPLAYPFRGGASQAAPTPDELW